MSTQQSDIQGTGGIGTLVTSDPHVAREAEKSLNRYLWNPLADIRIVGADGLHIRLGKGRSFYGVGRPGSGATIFRQGTETIDNQVVGTGVLELGESNVPGETIEQYEQRRGDCLLRCWVYPIWNIQYQESVYNLGKFTEAEQRSGNALGAGARTQEVTQYAGVCAADMVARYGETYGLCELKALTGMDNAEQATAEELVRLVQPYHYKLTNLRQEEEGDLQDEQTLVYDLSDRGPAYNRILGAGLDDTLRKKAMDILAQMRGRVRVATIYAKEQWFDLLKQLNDAKLGHKGVKRQPSKWDEHIAFLLGEAVPSAVARPDGNGGDPELREMMKTMAQYVAGQAPVSAVEQSEAELVEMRSLLSQMRGERTRLEKLKKEMGLTEDTV